MQPTIESEGIRFEFAAHNCFACGTLNANGLHLALHLEPERCWTELTLDRRFEGWDGIAHGGITSTILDEVMAWSVIGRGTWGVTARMTVDFRRPVPVGRAIRAQGEVGEAGRRLFRTTGQIVDAETGETLATAAGTYVAAPPERLAELQARYRLRRVDGPSDPPGTVDS